MKNEKNSIKELLDFIDFLIVIEKYQNNIPFLEQYSFINVGVNYIYNLMESLCKDINEFKSEDIYEQIKKMKNRISKMNVMRVKPIFLVWLYGGDKIKEILSNQKVQEHICEKDFLQRNKLQKFCYSDLHHSIFDKMIENIDCLTNEGNRFWVKFDHNDVNVPNENYIDKTGDIEFGNYIRLTVLSNDILEYDNSVFTLLSEQDPQITEMVKRIYRPYFLEYYIDTSDIDKIQKNFLLNTENSERWFKAYFSSDKEISGDTKGILFEGVFAYSASPVKYYRRKLVIEDSRLDYEYLARIDKTYNLSGRYCSKQSAVQKELETIFSGVIFNKVRIYKVGNGNCIYSYGSTGRKSKRLLYDIGFDNNTAVKEAISSIPFSYRASLHRIRRFIPNCIIISHWDSDHYKACVYGRSEIFECTWIAPDIKDANTNAKRLGIYMHMIGRMMLLDGEDKNKAIEVQLTKNSKLSLFIGKNVKGLSRINCEGIAVMHENRLGKNKKIRCMMQGDVPYMSLPPEANFEKENPYEYLVAPHHGSEMDCSLLSFPSSVDGKAVICCNNNSTKVKNRPSINHLNALRRCYDEVEVTENASNYIQLDLRKKNNMQKK